MADISDLSVVIPAYNEGNNIQGVIEELFSVIKKIPEIKKVQVIVVDDHSADATYEQILKLSDPRVICLRLSRRSGSHVALRAGLSLVKAQAALCISADGQDNPACLSEIVDRWKKGANVVWALRKDRNDEPWHIRRPAELFYKLLFLMLNTELRTVDLSRADFFFLDNKVVEAINSCPERNTSLFGLIVWLGFKHDFVEYLRRHRLSGRSKWNFRSRFHLAKDWIISFSGLPLKISSMVGMAMSVAGVFGVAYILIDKIFYSNVVTGWASTVILILTIGGIQLTILGVMGEYLWRNLDESRRRPLFFIEKKSG